MSAAKYLASKVDHEAEGLELRAERDEALKALAGSRARFADSEARRAELEAVIEKAKAHELSAFGDSDTHRILTASPSVVLEDRDREVAARTLEATADRWFSRGLREATDRVRERAAAIRKGDTNA